MNEFSHLGAFLFTPHLINQEIMLFQPSKYMQNSIVYHIEYCSSEASYQHLSAWLLQWSSNWCHCSHPALYYLFSIELPEHLLICKADQVAPLPKTAKSFPILFRVKIKSWQCPQIALDYSVHSPHWWGETDWGNNERKTQPATTFGCSRCPLPQSCLPLSRFDVHLLGAFTLAALSVLHAFPSLALIQCLIS